MEDCSCSLVFELGAIPSCVLHLKFLMSFSYLWMVRMFIDFGLVALTSLLCSVPFCLCSITLAPTSRSGNNSIEFWDADSSEAALESVV